MIFIFDFKILINFYYIFFERPRLLLYNNKQSDGQNGIKKYETTNFLFLLLFYIPYTKNLFTNLYFYQLKLD
jgi:hypothetical protein